MGSGTKHLERAWNLHHSGVAQGERRWAGVGLLIAPQLRCNVVEFTPVNKKVFSLHPWDRDRSLIVLPLGTPLFYWETMRVLLVGICARPSLSLTNTMFEHKGVHKCTWCRTPQTWRSMSSEHDGLSGQQIQCWICWWWRMLDRPKSVVRVFWERSWTVLTRSGRPQSHKPSIEDAEGLVHRPSQ